MSEASLSLEALEELKDIMGDEFSLLIETFLNDSITRVDALSTAIATDDAETVRSSAHSFKGSSSNICALQLTELCRQMEAMGKDGNLSAAGELLEQIKAEFAAVQAALEAL